MRKSEAFAPAKVNLALHVTGRRDDGYHLLDSLVVFADVCDRITASPSEITTLTVIGPRAAGVPTDGGNLVLRAAALMPGCPARIDLRKELPAASGIGGGSADAAATLRALSALHGVPLPPQEAVLALGADVPVCLAGRATRMSGIGETLSPVPALPVLPAVLVNPGFALSTPAVFKALRRRDNPPLEAIPSDLRSPSDLAVWLARQRNDLEPPACAIAPGVMDVLAALRGTQGCALARMSGSGATCFGLYGDPRDAARAAAEIARGKPDWWCAATVLR